MIFFLIPIVIFSIIIHEYSHAYVAYRLGDPTPKIQGRLTLNPLEHISILGTLILPVILLALTKGIFSFGYARRVETNNYFFKDLKKDMLLVALAGPSVNLSIGVVLLLFLKIIKLPVFYDLIFQAAMFNLALGLFNLLPVPPFDGAKIITYLVSYRQAYRYIKAKVFGIIIMVVFIILNIIQYVYLAMLRYAFYFVGVKP